MSISLPSHFSVAELLEASVLGVQVVRRPLNEAAQQTTNGGVILYAEGKSTNTHR